MGSIWTTKKERLMETTVELLNKLTSFNEMSEYMNDEEFIDMLIIIQMELD